jgi:hypothetical protein
MRWAWHGAHRGQSSNAYTVFTGKAEENRPLGNTRRKYKNIKKDFNEKEQDCVDWIHLSPNMDQWWAPVNMYD